MNEILKTYLPKANFDTYEDFIQNYKVNVPNDFNFGFDIVDRWAALQPDKKALLWCGDDFNMCEYTFTDMKKLSDKAANAFIDAGIKKGDRVMLILKQRPQVWWCIVALCKIGAICIPASFQLTKKDIIYRCDSANIKMIVSVDDENVITNIKNAAPECKTLKKTAIIGGADIDGFINFDKVIEQSSSELTRTPNNVYDPMLIYFSSGTTGMPKMVLHDHTLPLGHIVTALFWQKVQDNKVHLTHTDSGWAKFAWGKIYGQWICGACIGAYDTDKFTPELMIKAIHTIRPATFCATATIYRYFIKEDSLQGNNFSYIEHSSMAGEPLNPEVYNQIRTKTGLVIKEGFGQSESSVLLANYEWFDVKLGSMGKPSPLYDITLLDSSGKKCEDGEEGIICVRCDENYHPVGLFREYLLDKNEMKKSFKHGYYYTGDNAWRDSDGYYWFVGRSDDVIKCSGYRIGPFEVESALLEHASVLECAITAVPDPVRGQVVKATIVLAKGYAGSDELKKELQNHVKKVTAPYKYPRIIEFVTDLPKTISGKIRRKEIRDNDKVK